jgi:hypothetical protein
MTNIKTTIEKAFKESKNLGMEFTKNKNTNENEISPYEILELVKEKHPELSNETILKKIMSFVFNEKSDGSNK